MKAVVKLITTCLPLLSQPDSFPYKCDLLAMKNECLMLAVILTAICILVTKVTGSVAVIRPDMCWIQIFEIWPEPDVVEYLWAYLSGIGMRWRTGCLVCLHADNVHEVV